jgi:diketogulonate reductase-like aldo/keto reductase
MFGSPQGIDMGMLKREDVFVTTKLWNDDHHRVEDAMDDSLKVVP